MGFRTFDQDQWRRRIPYLKVGGAWVPVKKAQLKVDGTWRDFYNQQIIQPVIFIEELSNAQFTTYENVSILAGVSDGILHNEGSGWLRFDDEGTELIVSKKTIRHSVSWDHLNLKNVIYGNTVIDILGNQYKVRLLTGVDFSPFTDTTGYYLDGTHNSEWSRLFYPLVTDDAYLNNQYTGPKDPRYTNLDLGMKYVDATTLGTYSWCQETHLYGTNYRVLRGYGGASFLSRNTSSYANTNYGWRPCLERVV